MAGFTYFRVRLVGTVITTGPTITLTLSQGVAGIVLASSIPAGTNQIGGVNISQINGVTPLMGAGNTGTGSLRVTLPSDQVAIPVTNTPSTPTQRFTNSAATTNATSVKGSAGTLFAIHVSNINAAIRYLKLYNKATAPTVGTDVPVMVIPIPATGFASPNLGGMGMQFGTGIAFALTTGAADTDTAAVAASEIKVALAYQ
jgi:hypothetical protein